MKKVLCLVALASVLCLSACGGADDGGTVQNNSGAERPVFTNGAVDWAVEDGNATFKGNDIRMADFNTYEVETGAVPWSAEKDSIKTVAVENGVTYVGNYSFFDFDGIDSVEIAGTVDSIGSSAFAFCDNVVSIKLGDGIREIGMGAFGQCVSLREINIPESVTTIGKGAFYGCYSLADLTIPESVQVFGDADIFTGCTALTIHCVEGSEAHAQAEKYGIPFDFNI